MNNPLVSIIIPTYNRAHLIKETLDSIIAQTYNNWECIVVDDGSIDNTATVLESYIKKDNRFQYHTRPSTRKKGANACRNYGFEISKGEYVNWFDSDDLMHPEKIELEVKELINSGFSFVISSSMVFKENIENVILLRDNILSNNIFEDYLEIKINVFAQTVMLKREFLLENNFYFNEKLQAAQEWEFFCRVFLVESKYAVVNKVLSSIRNHENNISYDANDKKRLINYLKARIFIRETLLIKKMDVKYLDDYILSQYKMFLRKGWYSESLNILFKYLLWDNKINIKSKIKLIFGYLSFRIFKKGYFLLKRK